MTLTGPKPKHDFRICLHAADTLHCVTMPSVSCVSCVECTYQTQACKQEYASQSCDCHTVQFNKFAHNGDVCEATQPQADCEAAEAALLRRGGACLLRTLPAWHVEHRGGNAARFAKSENGNTGCVYHLPAGSDTLACDALTASRHH